MHPINGDPSVWLLTGRKTVINACPPRGSIKAERSTTLIGVQPRWRTIHTRRGRASRAVELGCTWRSNCVDSYTIYKGPKEISIPLLAFPSFSVDLYSSSKLEFKLGLYTASLPAPTASLSNYRSFQAHWILITAEPATIPISYSTPIDHSRWLLVYILNPTDSPN